MLIRFNEISPHGNHYELHDIKGLEDIDNISLKGERRVAFELRRKSDTKIELKGELEATALINCDRCLAPFEYPVHSDFHILFEVGDQSRWNVKEMECSSVELDTVLLDEPVIDVSEAVRQQLLLSLPDKKICSDTCKGICYLCGKDLNLEPCDCDRSNRSSPFAALAKLKK